MRITRNLNELRRKTPEFASTEAETGREPLAPAGYRSSVPRRLLLWSAGLAAVLAATVFAATGFGAAGISLSDSFDILSRHFGREAGAQPAVLVQIVEEVRLPRILGAALVGAALAASGVVMQGVFRNPLADPGVIGVSSGGAVGGVLAMATGAASVNLLTLPALAFAGALGAGVAVYGIATLSGRASRATLILAGIAVSSFLGAVISLVLLLTEDFTALRQILFWLLGGLDAKTWVHVRVLAPPILLGLLACVALARPLNAMLLGDETARGLGIEPRRVRLVLLILASLMTGVSVAITGIISFVGLVVPHALRLLAGPDHRILLPASALAGAIFLVAADTLARSIAAPVEIRVGVVTAFVGAPTFLALLVRTGRRAETITD